MSNFSALLRGLAAGASPWKLACRAVSTSNITLSGEQTIDGVSIVSGDRVLVAGQTDAKRNGIYNASTGAWSRADDANVDNFMVLGSRVSVLEGASAGDWSLTSPTTGSVRIDTTELTFSQHDAPSSTSYTAGLVTMSGRKRMTYSGSATAVIAQASSGHADGSELVIDFPAGSATSLYLSPAVNVNGDCTIDPSTYQVTDWDSAVANVLYLARYGGVTIGSLRTTAAADAVAPTVLSAAADSTNPDAVRVTFSEPVYVRAVTGLSLSFSVGTARTITAIESGDGTTTVTFTLSGNLSATDVFSFVVGSTRVGTDYSGNLIATSTTAVKWGLVAKAAWTRCFEAGVAMLPATGLPANFTSWTDQVGGALQFTQAGAGHASRTSDPAVKFTNDATQRLHCNTSPVSGTDFALFGRYKFTSVAAQDWIPFCYDTDGSSSKWLRIICTDNATSVTVQLSIYDGTTEHTVSDSYSSDTAYHSVFIWRTGGTIYMQIDSRSPVSVSDSLTVTSLSNISIGNLIYAGPTSYKPSNGSVSDLALKAGAAFVGTEKADIIAYIAAR